MAARITRWVVFGLLTALFAYLVIAAVGNLVLLPQMAAEIGLGVNGTGWFWLWAGIALPAVAYAAALVIARKRTAGGRLLILATALALTAAVQLEILHLVPQSTFFTA